jgi:hypothetical protein
MKKSLAAAYMIPPLTTGSQDPSLTTGSQDPSLRSDGYRCRALSVTKGVEYTY